MNNLNLKKTAKNKTTIDVKKVKEALEYIKQLGDLVEKKDYGAGIVPTTMDIQGSKKDWETRFSMNGNYGLQTLQGTKPSFMACSLVLI